MIISWSVLLLGCLVLSVWYPVFGGVAIGAIVTALMLGLAIKWGSEAMMDGMVNDLESVSEHLDEADQFGTIQDDDNA